MPEATVEMERLATTLDHAKKPKAAVIAALVHPANPIVAETSERDLLAATRTLRLELHVLASKYRT